MSSWKGENERLQGKLSSMQQQLQEALSTHGQLPTPFTPSPSHAWHVPPLLMHLSRSFGCADNTCIGNDLSQVHGQFGVDTWRGQKRMA